MKSPKTAASYLAVFINTAPPSQPTTLFLKGCPCAQFPTRRSSGVDATPAPTLHSRSPGLPEHPRGNRSFTAPRTLSANTGRNEPARSDGLGPTATIPLGAGGACDAVIPRGAGEAPLRHPGPARPRRQRRAKARGGPGTPAERCSGPLPGPAGRGQAGGSAAPLGTRGNALPALGSAAVIYPGKRPGRRERACGRPQRIAHRRTCSRGLSGMRAAAAPRAGPTARPRPRWVPTDPPAACVPRNGCVRLQERPAGQSPHTPGALAWRTLPLCRRCEWAVGAAMLYGS